MSLHYTIFCSRTPTHGTGNNFTQFSSTAPYGDPLTPSINRFGFFAKGRPTSMKALWVAVCKSQVVCLETNVQKALEECASDCHNLCVLIQVLSCIS